MTITIANEAGAADKSMLADSMIVLRIPARKRVLLLDSDPHPPVSDMHVWYADIFGELITGSMQPC